MCNHHWHQICVQLNKMLYHLYQENKKSKLTVYTGNVILPGNACQALCGTPPEALAYSAAPTE
jgi:hypothetical protein